MWFGCRTQSQDLLPSTPCPDGTSSCALGINNPVPCTAWKEHGKGLQSPLMVKHKILDPG